VGVRLEGGENLRATKGVIFGSGGFSQNREMLKEHIPHPVYMTGAAKGATGDFHSMAMQMGAEMACMDKIWGCQTFMEQSFEKWDDEVCLFQVRGDSMLMVNKTGKRVMNEKSAYDMRVRKHWEKKDGEYPNHLLFLVGDERCMDTFGANFAKTWPADPNHAYYIKGDTFQELSDNIAARLKTIEAKLPSAITLDEDFGSQLEATVDRFNGFAESGKDLDFNRGAGKADSQWTISRSNTMPNVTMHPLASTGPYYCLILAPSLIDTKGGPVINTDAQVVHNNRSPIGGLYGAGNAAAPISGDAYWSGGATLGSAMVTGWIAGKSAALADGTSLN